MKTSKLPLLAATAVVCAAFSLATANAAVIAQWNFATAPSSGSPNAGYITPQSTETTAADQTVSPWTPPTGITVSTLTLGTGTGTPTLTNSSGHLQGAQAYSLVSYSGTSNIAADFAAGSYEQFTITISAGYSLSLTGVTISTGKGNFNQRPSLGNSYFSSSVTGSTTALGSGANGWVWRSFEPYSSQHGLFPYTVDLTSANSAAGTSLQNLTNTSVTFYVPIDYSVNNEPAGIQNLILNGNLSSVPEPATWALLAFSLTTVMVLRRRRRA